MMHHDGHSRTRTRSALLLSLILHILLAMIYLFYPRDYSLKEEESIPVEWIKDVDAPKLRKATLKPNTEKTVTKNREVGRKAENKLARQSSNDITEVMEKSKRMVTRNVEIAKANPTDILPAVTTAARLNEANTGFSRMVSLKGRTDGDGKVTGRVRIKGDGDGLDLINSYGTSGDGLLGGGGDPGVSDRLDMIKYLKEQDGPQRVVYCLDTSASMAAAGLRKLDLAIDAVKDSISMLRDVDEFNLVTFHGEAKLFRKEMLPASVESAGEAFKYLRRFTPTSIMDNRGTDILEALRLALQLEPTVVFFVTDGLPAPDPAHPDRVVVDTQTILDAVHDQNVSNARIYVVGLELDPQYSRNARLLVALADQNNGHLKVVDNDELVRYTQSLADRSVRD